MPIDSGSPLIAAVLVGFGLVLAGVGVRYGLRSARIAWRYPPTTVREAVETGGIVDIEGTAEPIDSVVASPYDGQECLVYEATRKRRAVKSDWRTEAESRHGVPFLVTDDTGGILVDPADATLELATGTSFHAEQQSEDPAEDLAGAARREHDGGLRSSLGVRQVPRSVVRRFEERRIDPGELVHVRGPVHSDAAGARTGGALSAAIRGTVDEPVFLSDTDQRTTMLRMGLTSVLGLVFGAALLWAAVQILTGAA